MAKQKQRPGTKEIVALAESLFGARVMQVTAPGGKKRDSLRVHFRDRTVIATYRHRPGRAHRETTILRHLSPLCDDMPRFLGFENGVLFQSDVGGTRLSQQVQGLDAAGRADLAAQAVASIFRIQAAARRVSELEELPHLGAMPDWVEAVVDEAARLARRLGRSAPNIDREALCERLAQPPAQFTKWDCRPGNAALAGDGRIAWFDFEYSGRRHGAEDIAFLIGDEVWPVDAGTMFDIVTQQFDRGCGHPPGAYLEYLGLYATFHAVQRIRLVLSEVDRRGWSSQERALRYDKVGTHPLMGAGVSEHAAQCADRHALTRPLVPLFEEMARTFYLAMPDGRERLAG